MMNQANHDYSRAGRVERASNYGPHYYQRWRLESEYIVSFRV
jgi:hypothetical protein